MIKEEDKTFLCGILIITTSILFVLGCLMCLCCYLNQRWPEKRIYELKSEQMELIIRTIQVAKK